jgi:hypothetical protein
MNNIQEETPISKPKFFLDLEIRTWLKDNLEIAIYKHGTNATSIYLPNANKYVDVVRLDTYVYVSIDKDPISRTYVNGTEEMNQQVNFIKQIDDLIGNMKELKNDLHDAKMKIIELEEKLNKTT